MIAAADGAERRIERRRRKTDFGHRSCNVTFPRHIECAQAIGRLSDAKLAHGQVELEQTHAAADVGADELRMNRSARMLQPTAVFSDAGPACRQLL
jgi:hypothetical protein